MHEPAGIALDSSLNTYVANYSGDSVTVFAAGANGNVTHIDIVGSYTDLTAPTALALDAEDNIYVANSIGNSITVYAAGATGNVAPIRAIAGSLTNLAAPTASPSMPQATSTSRTQTFTSLARPA